MQQLITVSLNDLAIQIEEEGYVALHQYLERAKGRLKGNPDRDEILSDIERAIGEKCSALLNSTKTIVTTAEVKGILDEVGPVEDAGGEETKNETGSAGRPDSEAQQPRRLYRIGEDAILAGVCKGLAVYLGVDVLLVRLVFVGLTIMTSGIGGVLAYLVMVFSVPYAPESTQRPGAGRILKTILALLGVAVVLYGVFIWLRPGAHIPPSGLAEMGLLLGLSVLVALIAIIVRSLSG